MKINKWLFWIIFGVYSIVSIAAFTFTSAGWTAFLFVWPGSTLAFATCVLVLLIINSVQKDRKELFLPKKLLGALIIAQVLAILFNSGDCGDGNCSFQFIQILTGPPITSGSQALIPGISPILFLAYFVLLIGFLKASYTNKFDNL